MRIIIGIPVNVVKNKSIRTQLYLGNRQGSYVYGKGSKHEQCTVCNYAKTAVEIPPVKTGTEETKTSYKIIEGTESSYVLQSGNSLTIRVDAEFSKFAGIKVDGVQIGKIIMM